MIYGDFNGGKVGIGTTNPTATFQIKDFLLYDKGNKSIGYNYFWDYDHWERLYSEEASQIQFSDDGRISCWVASYGSGGSTIYWNQAIEILNNGKVGINTTSVPADGRLAVNGKIYATEVEVQTYPWSDIVFKEGYKLMSLSDLENYIKTNHRLPDVPSENDIQLNGHNLGEMDAILLRKIEELTLYILELKKKLDEIDNK